MGWPRARLLWAGLPRSALVDLLGGRFGPAPRAAPARLPRRWPRTPGLAPAGRGADAVLVARHQREGCELARCAHALRAGSSAPVPADGAATGYGWSSSGCGPRDGASRLVDRRARCSMGHGLSAIRVVRRWGTLREVLSAGRATFREPVPLAARWGNGACLPGRDASRRAVYRSRVHHAVIVSSTAPTTSEYAHGAARSGSRPRRLPTFISTLRCAAMPVSTVLFDVGDVVCRFRPARRLAALAAVSPYPAEELRAIWALAFDGPCRARCCRRGGRHVGTVLHDARISACEHWRVATVRRCRSASSSGGTPDTVTLQCESLR